MVWLSINEYSRHMGVSISTIRRHIRSSKLVSKKEDGKYYIFVNMDKEFSENNSDLKLHKLENKIKELENKLRKVQEENNELIMLVNLYENNQSNNNTFC